MKHLKIYTVQILEGFDQWRGPEPRIGVQKEFLGIKKIFSGDTKKIFLGPNNFFLSPHFSFWRGQLN